MTDDGHMGAFDRVGAVTASVVPAILRLDTKSRKWAWRVITGREPAQKPGWDIQRGLDHEDDAVNAAECLLGRLADPGCYTPHPTIDWLGASPDGFVYEVIVVEGNEVEVRIPLECKCPRVLHQSVPPNYYAQVQTQLECCGAPYGYFVSWVGDAQRVIKVERDHQWWQDNFPAIEQFYNEYVLTDIEPPKSPRRKKDVQADR